MSDNKETEVTATEQSATEKTAPEKAASKKAAPEKAVPEKAAPEEVAPEKAAAAEAAPEKAASENAAPAKAAPEEVAPEKAAAAEAAAEEAAPEQAPPAQAAPEREPREDRQGRRGGRDRNQGRDRGGRGDDKNQFLERVVTINRVSKVVKGGRRFSFTALVVVGDGNGLVGVGYGKAREVPLAISKGVEEAKRNFFRVPRVEQTIPHPVQGEAAAGVVLLRPAAAGTGVIAGGPVRAVLECAGIHDVLSKSLGSSNTLNIVHATVAALQQLEEPRSVAARRGLDFDHVAPARLVRAEAAAAAKAAEPKVGA